MLLHDAVLWYRIMVLQYGTASWYCRMVLQDGIAAWYITWESIIDSEAP